MAEYDIWAFFFWKLWIWCSLRKLCLLSGKEWMGLFIHQNKPHKVADKALCKTRPGLQMGLAAWWSTASPSDRWSKQEFIKRATSNFAYAVTAVWWHTVKAGQLLLSEPAKGTLPYAAGTAVTSGFKLEREGKTRIPWLSFLVDLCRCGINIAKILFSDFLSFAIWKTHAGSWWASPAPSGLHKLFPLHALPVGLRSVRAFRSSTIIDFIRK